MLQASNVTAADIETLDSRHEQMFKLINAFATCLQHRGPSEHLCRLALRALINHSKTEFSDEQALMQAVGVDARHVSKHQMEHRSLMYDMDQLVAQLDMVTCEGVARVSDKLLQLMSSWLIHHIMGTDQTMARQIAAIKRGISAGAAFALHQMVKPDATTARPPVNPTLGRCPDARALCWQLAEKLAALSSHPKLSDSRKRLAA